jgi:hypothetical protein
MTALLLHYGQWVHLPCQRAQGPAIKPHWVSLLQLLYAQVIKTTRCRRLVEVKHRAMFGTHAVVDQILAQWRLYTPAMAAGLTDHVWTLRGVLLFRVPPWPQPAGL